MTGCLGGHQPARVSRRRLWVTWVATAAVAAGITSCRPAGTVETEGPAQVEVTMSEYRFDYDHAIARGRAVFRVRNEGHEDHEIVVAILPPEVPPIAEQLKGEERRFIPGLATLPVRRPGESNIFALDLAPGRYALLCFVRDKDGTPHARKGMSSEFEVR